jgi:signal transduction histidine kinase
VAVEKTQVNLNVLLTEVVDSLAFSEKASQIKIEKAIPASLELITDSSRLKVILANLISNAIRYSDLKKEPPFILIEASSNVEEVKIMVKDNGQGIAPEHHVKIFDMFYRASVNSKGSGLGLYIVKESLDRIGGSIKLSSELGVGSTFTVVLPKGHGISSN